MTVQQQYKIAYSLLRNMHISACKYNMLTKSYGIEPEIASAAIVSHYQSKKSACVERFKASLRWRECYRRSCNKSYVRIQMRGFYDNSFIWTFRKFLEEYSGPTAR